jgi:predicted Zn-dependent protease with MMP-like domain
VALLSAMVSLALVRLGAWREPRSEKEFERLVQHTEWLAAAGQGEPDGGPGWAPSAGEDPGARAEDDPFDVLVRRALDELPIEFHRALEHVAIVISDRGREAMGGRGAYGLYEGDTVAQDFFHERITIFRDTLQRDFGHDPELLRAQVARTLRHELAHHLGWGERGVRGLGL